VRGRNFSSELVVHSTVHISVMRVPAVGNSYVQTAEHDVQRRGSCVVAPASAPLALLRPLRGYSIAEAP
jgi:hypothetical protein